MKPDDRQRVHLNGLGRSIQRMRMIVEEGMPPCLAVSELDLMELRLSNIRGSAIEDGDMLEEILSHVDFDGIDSNGITIGELRRALPKAPAVTPVTRRSPAHCQTCGRTDKEYSHSAGDCTDPWHADDHLRVGGTSAFTSQESS